MAGNGWNLSNFSQKNTDTVWFLGWFGFSETSSTTYQFLSWFFSVSQYTFCAQTSEIVLVIVGKYLLRTNDAILVIQWSGQVPNFDLAQIWDKIIFLENLLFIWLAERYIAA